jgi:hypothetical protein
VGPTSSSSFWSPSSWPPLHLPPWVAGLRSVRLLGMLERWWIPVKMEILYLGVRELLSPQIWGDALIDFAATTM